MDLPFTIKEEKEVNYLLTSHVVRISDINEEPNEYSMNLSNESPSYRQHDTSSEKEQTKESNKSNEKGQKRKRRAKTATESRKRKLAASVTKDGTVAIESVNFEQTLNQTTSSSHATLNSIVYPTIRESPIFKDLDDFDLTIVQAKFMKHGNLSSSDRSKISRCIIKCLLKKSTSKTISRNEFENAAGTIAATFPGEVASSFFIPSEGDVAPSGKLYQSYKTLRDELAEAGMITKRHQRTTKSNELPDETFIIQSADFEETLNQSTDDELQSNVAGGVMLSTTVIGVPSSSNGTLNSSVYPTIWESPVFNDLDDFDLTIVQAKFMKHGNLSSSDRCKISRCIIKCLLKKSASKTISRNEFENAAGTIAATFPGEVASSFFTPSEGEVAASGKLYQSYKTLRDELAEAGMITKRNQRKKRKSTYA